MIRNLSIFFMGLCLFWGAVAQAEMAGWADDTLGKLIVRADKAARGAKWNKAIKYGERAITRADQLVPPQSLRYINLLKNVNDYYEKVGRSAEIRPRIKRAYDLAATTLGPDHAATRDTRAHYLAQLLAEKKYMLAIPLVTETIDSLKRTEEEEYSLPKLYTTLYSLYALTGDFAKEQITLEILLKLNLKLYVPEAESTRRILMDLAINYCRQNEQQKFNQLTGEYSLKLVC